jgi:hypothetical protein
VIVKDINAEYFIVFSVCEETVKCKCNQNIVKRIVDQIIKHFTTRAFTNVFLQGVLHCVLLKVCLQYAFTRRFLNLFIQCIYI